MHFKGENYKRKYIKTMGMTEEHFNIIGKICGKKSKSGKLEEIINFYLANKHL